MEPRRASDSLVDLRAPAEAALNAEAALTEAAAGGVRLPADPLSFARLPSDDSGTDSDVFLTRTPSTPKVATRVVRRDARAACYEARATAAFAALQLAVDENKAAEAAASRWVVPPRWSPQGCGCFDFLRRRQIPDDAALGPEVFPTPCHPNRAGAHR